MSETQSVKRSGYQRSAQMQSSQQHRDHALCLVLAVVDRHLGEYVEVKKRQRMLASLITTHNLQGMAKEASTLVLRTLTPEQFFNWIARLAKFTAQGAGGTKAFFEKGSKAIQSAKLARLGYQPEAKQSSDEQSVPGSSSLQYRASSVLEDSGHGHVKATPAKSKQQDSGPAIVAPLAIAESDSTYSMQMEKTRQLIPRIIATPSLANATTREHVSESSSPFNPAKINSSSSERQNSVDEQVPAEGPLHDFAKTISSDYSGSERSEQPIDGVASESPAKTEGSGSVFGGTEAKQVFESTSPRSAAEAASPMNKRKHNASDNDREKEKSQSLLLPTTLDAGRPGPASEGPGPSSKTLRRDYNLTRLGDNEVKRYLDDIWTFMQSSTQHFINKLRIDAEGPARFDPNPPGDLQALYVKLFGVEWQTRKRVLGYAKALLAPDLIAALLAAAVHDAGFCRPITWQIPEEKLAEMQAAGELGAATRVAQSAGSRLDAEGHIRHLCQNRMNDKQFQTKTILPLARKHAEKIVDAIMPQLEVLGSHALGVRQAQDFETERTTEIEKIVSKALIVRGLMSAAPDEYSAKWIASGQELDLRTMEELRGGQGSQEVVWCVTPVIRVGEEIVCRAKVFSRPV